jgi:hypothetical protein
MNLWNFLSIKPVRQPGWLPRAKAPWTLAARFLKKHGLFNVIRVLPFLSGVVQKLKFRNNTIITGAENSRKRGFGR